MALQSMTALASITLQEPSTSVSFSGIPQNYRDLVLVANASSSANAFLATRFNGDTSTNYGYVAMIANTVAYSNNGNFTEGYLADNQQKANARYQVQMSVIDYCATDKHKATLVRTSGETVIASGPTETPGVYATSIHWGNTTAVNSIALYGLSGNFNVGSTFDLYGRIG